MWLYDAATGVSYELIREIHHGGEGRTWRARQCGRSRQELAVAVKILSCADYPNHKLDIKDVFALWQEQAEIIRYFNDRAFVPIQAVFWTAAAPGRPEPPGLLLGLPAVVTAWVDGQGLREWSEHVEDPLARLAVLEFCAGALDRFHRKTGHVHRDLNPNNILVASDGIAEIIDYGLLRDASIARTGTEPIGTFAYLAPEIIEGSPYSPATDRYSFGAILFHQLLRLDPPQIGTAHRLTAIAGRLAAGGYPTVATLIAGWLHEEPELRPAVTGAEDMLGQVLRGVRALTNQPWSAAGRRTAEPTTAPLAAGSDEWSYDTAILHPAGVDQAKDGALPDFQVALSRVLLAASAAFVIVLAAFAFTHLLS